MGHGAWGMAHGAWGIGYNNQSKIRAGKASKTVYFYAKKDSSSLIDSNLYILVSRATQETV
jgi:hypothetical protein